MSQVYAEMRMDVTTPSFVSIACLQNLVQKRNMAILTMVEGATGQRGAAKSMSQTVHFLTRQATSIAAMLYCTPVSYAKLCCVIRPS